MTFVRRRYYLRDTVLPVAQQLPLGTNATLGKWPEDDDLYYPDYGQPSNPDYENLLLSPTAGSAPTSISAVTNWSLDAAPKNDYYLGRWITEPLKVPTTFVPAENIGGVMVQLGLALSIDDNYDAQIDDPCVGCDNEFVQGGGLIVYIYRPSTASVVGFILDGFGDAGEFDTDRNHEYFWMLYGYRVGTPFNIKRWLEFDPVNSPTNALIWKQDPADYSNKLTPNNAPGDHYYSSPAQLVEAEAGDVLVIELWSHFHSLPAATTGQVDVWFNGTDEPVEGALNSNVSSYVDVFVFSPDPPERQHIIGNTILLGKVISQLPEDYNGSQWAQMAAPVDNVWQFPIRIVDDFIDKEIVKVTVGPKLYSNVGSLAECHATPKTWLHHRVNGYLAIDPAGETEATGSPVVDLNEQIVIAWWGLYLSNCAIFIDGEWYDPRLILNNKGFQTKVGVVDRLFNSAFLSGGNAEYWNGDKRFDKLYSDYEWLTGEAVFNHAFEFNNFNLDLSIFQQIRKTFVSGYKRNDFTAAVSFSQVQRRTDNKALQMIYMKTTDPDRPWNPAYANLPETMEGKIQPAIWGDFSDTSGTKLERVKRGVVADVVDPGNETGVDSGQFNDRWFKWMAELTDPETGIKYGGDVTQVLQVKPDGTIAVIPSGKYDLEESNTLIKIGPSGGFDVGDTDTIIVLGNGYRDKTSAELTADGFPAFYATQFSGVDGGLINEPQNFAHFCEKMLGGLKTAEIDIPAHTKLTFQKPNENGVLVNGTFEPPAWFSTILHYERSDVTVTDLLNLAASGLKHIFIQGLDGKITTYLISSADSNIDNNTPFLVDADYGSFEEGRGLESLVSSITVEYAINLREESENNDESHQRRKKRKKIKSSTKTAVGPISVFDQYALALGIDKEITIKTMITDPVAAALIGQAYYNAFKRGAIDLETSELMNQLAEHLPGKPILFIRDRAIGGAIYEKPYLPTELGRSYGVGTSLKLIEGKDIDIT